MTFEEDSFFEDEVRRIARARWPQAQFDGSAMIDGRERDGVFETDDVIHYVETTRSRREEKAKDDTKKMFGLMTEQQRQRSMKGSIGWFVTQDEPTADQREAVRQYGKGQVKAVSFSQFQQALVDVPQYFSKRENHFFGSIADPVTGELKTKISYIPLDLTLLSNGDLLDVHAIASGLSNGESYTLLGDYGAGKSMTLRQLYFQLRDKYRSGGTPKFPIYLNLREHSGQDDPSEVLERHARRLGFDKPHSLVSAWRAGFALLILDGFDEITTLGVSAARSKLREARRRSLEAVRALIAQTPREAGFIIAGRDHFFSSPDERLSALGIRTNTKTIAVGELTRKQIASYLKQIAGKELTLPPWLPTRPLLVAYIATRGLLDELGDVLQSIDSTDGWHLLLDRIFERESKISPSLDGITLRRILERLATVARSTNDGLGPITQQQIRASYIQICESEPDEQANLLLQRLPGLGVYRDEDDSRTFVDVELAEVCRARDITDFVVNPYGLLQDDGWKGAMQLASAFSGQTAITRVSRNLLEQRKLASSKIDAALQASATNGEIGALRADLAALAVEASHPLATETVVSGEIFENYTLVLPSGETDLSNLIFRDCLFECIEISSDANSSFLPKFQGCIFLLVRGRTCREDMPSSRFDNRCSYEKFADSSETQSAILNSNLSRGEKLVFTILRKLFIQSLSGRAESALYRGLDLNDRQLVPDAIRLLQQHGLLMLYSRGDGNVWIPVRKEIARARRILSAPATCGDILVSEARKICK
ncbi:NACHT domain-containing protein [Uliginosibacterium sp. 31-16]|uniref:NACHT domain-containing protein n=1 Tax=Uliginosibacterium sp. 31-16 TaxID=3068315 RepID=UPI00273F3132|nr:NACHT domain-containing protein [Uliginosibacterium sp. 31-16]MDP5240556.1 NACHT domain-containing protein [Uliginosibacterium sp. 31-16]